MAQLTATQAYNPKMGDGSRGILQVVIADSETVTLKGSVNGTDYATIEVFTASVIKEIALVPYFKFEITGGSNGATVDSKVYIDETR